MSMATVAKQRPPSPASSNGGDLLHNINLLAQHNAGYSYRPSPNNTSDVGYTQSSPQSRYGSPVPSHYAMPGEPYGSNLYPNGHQGQHYLGGLGFHIDNQGNPLWHHNHSSNYPELLPDQHAHMYHFSNIHTPPTPTSEAGHLGMRTRSGRSIPISASPQSTKSEKGKSAGSPKTKKMRQTKADKPKVPKITAPLSQLTKDYDKIPIKNMEEWVNRSAETRHKEVEKRNGYVTRPMNSFMLYRSAYAERTKLWCLQNNHQVVSAVSGESWPLEPKEIREHYNDLAKLERDNHQKAHPGYKFCPSKAQATVKKRKSYSDEDDEPSDLDEGDPNWAPPDFRKPRPNYTQPKRQRGQGLPLVNYLGGPMFDTHNGLNRSSYQTSNPGRVPPAPIVNQDELAGEFYQTTVQHINYPVPHVEDVMMRKTEAPNIQFRSVPPLIGLPGSHHYELLQQRSQHSTPAPLGEPQLDPALLNMDFHQDGGQVPSGDGSFDVFGNSQQPSFQYDGLPSSYDPEGLFGNSTHIEEYQHPASIHPGMQTLTDGNEVWGRDSGVSALEDSEFEKWMGEHNNR